MNDSLFLRRCVDALENLRSTPEAVSGYSAALAALIAGVSSSSLGIPHNRGKVAAHQCHTLALYLCFRVGRFQHGRRAVTKCKSKQPSCNSKNPGRLAVDRIGYDVRCVRSQQPRTADAASLAKQFPALGKRAGI